MISSDKNAQLDNDPRVTRNINFNAAPDAAAPAKVPVRHAPYIDKSSKEVMATPADNIKVVKRILEMNRTPEAIDQVYDLVGKALEQQERATTSQRLASDAKACRSSARKEKSPTPKIREEPRDHQSQTGSTERRR